MAARVCGSLQQSIESRIDHADIAEELANLQIHLLDSQVEIAAEKIDLGSMKSSSEKLFS
jgi:hypothetical protein